MTKEAAVQRITGGMMQRDTLIGIGITILLAFLQWRVRTMPYAITAAGIVFGLGLIMWPYLPSPPKYNGPLFLSLLAIATLSGALAWARSVTTEVTPRANQLVATLFADPQSHDRKSYSAFWANSVDPNLLYGWFGDSRINPPKEKFVTIYLTNAGPGDVRHVRLGWELHSEPIHEQIQKSGLFRHRITGLGQDRLWFSITRDGNGTNSGSKLFALTGDSEIPVIRDGQTQHALLPERVNEALFLSALCTATSINSTAAEYNRRTHKIAPLDVRDMPTITLTVRYENANGNTITQIFEMGGFISMSNMAPTGSDGRSWMLEPEGVGAGVFITSIAQK